MHEPTQTPWLTDTAFATLRDRYIPQTCLGRKAGRQTWLAIDQVTGDSVVVKRLAFGRDFLWDDLKLFEREAQTLKSIDHPAIPKYLDFFDLESEGEQGFALVQSYIDARSLEEHVKSGRRFSESDLKEIAIQVLEILDYLHHCQPPVIHRDIKPSNILLAESEDGVGTVYLVDFGSVQSLAAREGSTITIVGTYGYMPPEQFGGRAYPSSDFYSLGATLIYLATGKHPADIPQGKDLRLNFEPSANLSLEMTEWIREMIHPLADERPDSAKSLIGNLRNPAIKMIDPLIVCEDLKTADKYPTTPMPLGCRIDLNKDINAVKFTIPASMVRMRNLNWDQKDYFWYKMKARHYFVVILLLIVATRSVAIFSSIGLLLLLLLIVKMLLDYCAKNKGVIGIEIDNEFIKINREGLAINPKTEISKKSKAWQITVKEFNTEDDYYFEVGLMVADISCLVVCTSTEAYWFAAELSNILEIGIDD
jgi:serine/threonine protein kinase